MDSNELIKKNRDSEAAAPRNGGDVGAASGVAERFSGTDDRTSGSGAPFASSKSTASGPSTAGPSNGGPASTSPSTAGPSTAGPSSNSPSSAGPSNGGPASTGPSTAGPSSTGPSASPDLRSLSRQGFPTVADGLVFFGIFLLANLAGSFAAWAVGLPWPSPQAAAGDETGVARFNAVAYFVTMSLTLSGLLLYRARRGGPRSVAHFSRRGLHPALLLWGVAFMAATSVVIEPLLSLLPEVPAVYGRGPWAFLTLVVMAPLFEEVIFRGVILSSMRLRYGVMAAWVVSSLIFGLVHLHPTVAVNAFFMGLILAFFYIATDSLWASILLHAVNNGIAYLLLAGGYGSASVCTLVGSPTLYAAIYLCAAVLFIGSLGMTLLTLHRLKASAKNGPAA